MKGKTAAKLREVVGPLLQQSETIEFMTVATVGASPTKRMLSSSLMSGGLLIAVPVRHYIIVTDRRLLFVLQDVFGRPKDSMSSFVAREPLRVKQSGSSLLYRWIVMTSADDPDFVLRVNFAFNVRGDAPKFAALFSATQ